MKALVYRGLGSKGNRQDHYLRYRPSYPEGRRGARAIPALPAVMR
jgi:hypothetical protein